MVTFTTHLPDFHPTWTQICAIMHMFHTGFPTPLPTFLWVVFKPHRWETADKEISITKDDAHSAGPALHAGWRSELDSVLIHMLGLLLVPEPCRGKKRPSTGHQLRVLKEAKLGMFSRYWSVCGCLQEEGQTCSLYCFCIRVGLWKLVRVSMCALAFVCQMQSKEARQRVGAAGEGIQPAQATCH